jgi:alkylation response protein AidB-like acyl-CoA dehydrogenase
MASPGITVRPLILMDGSHEVNEVFLDDVRVPAANLVHEEGTGWTVAKYLLGYERMNSGRVGASKRQLARLKEFAQQQTEGGRRLIDNLRFRDKVSRVEIELMALEITNLRFLDRMRRTGKPPGDDVSLLKLKGTAIQQTISELMLQAAGPLAQRGIPAGDAGMDNTDALLAALGPRYFNLRKLTIAGGADEIQRNIIARMSLGL